MTDLTAKHGPSQVVEFWFDFASSYSYLSVMRIQNEADRHQVGIVWRPFLLGPIFKAMGMENSPFVLQKEKGAYVRQDMLRQCRKYGLQWKEPSTFPRLGVLPARIALLGAEQVWIGEFCRQVMKVNFVFDEDINDPDRLAPILAGLGLPSSDILRQAQAEPIKVRLRDQTDEARTRGIFGAPTFFVGTEMFWGNDRLDDALQFASDRQRSSTRCKPRASSSTDCPTTRLDG